MFEDISYGDFCHSQFFFQFCEHCTFFILVISAL